MKIKLVTANNRKKAFEVTTRKDTYEFPYAKLEIAPSSRDKITSAYPDKDFGNEAFSYQLESGRESTVHMDAVLEYNQDPATMRDLLLHQLTVTAKKLVAESPYSHRTITRRLGTSSSQFYRILDEANTAKKFDQLIFLFHALDHDVDFKVHPRGT